MLARIFAYLNPTAEYVVIGDITNETDYDKNVTWLSATAKPSWAEFMEAKSAVEIQISQENVKNQRRNAYLVEADPLYFGWQRGENTEQAWLDKVAEIRARYPYPT